MKQKSRGWTDLVIAVLVIATAFILGSIAFWITGNELMFHITALIVVAPVLAWIVYREKHRDKN